MVSIATDNALEYLLDVCATFQLDVTPQKRHAEELELTGPSGEPIFIDLLPGRFSMLEQMLRGLHFDFNALPILVCGESKEIRLLTPRIALARLLPTVYSYTANRYGIAPGTDLIRAYFSAEIFRSMMMEPLGLHLSSAFLGLVDSPVGPLLAEEVIEACNLEVRVKRFHIGSPLHRYRYTENYSTACGGAPIQRWTRFREPIVCFDWRQPTHDEQGFRLADEPMSDDYAGIWIDDVQRAKELARRTFQWIERRFSRAGLQLVDICFFIDRTGSVIYGEISPDCMRVRSRGADDAEALDKDHWRSGGAPQEIASRYERLYDLVFGPFKSRTNYLKSK